MQALLSAVTQVLTGWSLPYRLLYRKSILIISGLIDVQRDSGKDGFIVTNPNCSTIMMVAALAPLQDRSNFRISGWQLMQAISGAGFSGVSAMAIYDNVIPYIGTRRREDGDRDS
jgi:aspartate-semialdehyde dehydrogenase